MERSRFPDGMYHYGDLNNFIQGHVGKAEGKEGDDAVQIFTLYFHTTIYPAVILIHNDYEFDLSQFEFSGLLGFDRKVFQDENNVGDRVPDITRNVDWVFIHCDLISRKVDNVGSDVLFALSTANLQVSYHVFKRTIQTFMASCQ